MDGQTIAAFAAAGIAALAAIISIMQTSLARKQAISAQEAAKSAETQAREAQRQSIAAEEQVALARAQVDEQRRENSDTRLDILTSRVDMFATRLSEWRSVIAEVGAQLVNGGFTSTIPHQPTGPERLFAVLDTYSEAYRLLTKAVQETLRFHGHFREILNAIGETLRLAQAAHGILMQITQHENPPQSICDAAVIEIAQVIHTSDEWLNTLNSRMISALVAAGRVAN